MALCMHEPWENIFTCVGCHRPSLIMLISSVISIITKNSLNLKRGTACLILMCDTWKLSRILWRLQICTRKYLFPNSKKKSVCFQMQRSMVVLAFVFSELTETTCGGTSNIFPWLCSLAGALSWLLEYSNPTAYVKKMNLGMNAWLDRLKAPYIN